MTRERRNDIIAIALIILVILIRFYPFVLFGSSICSDSWKSYYPWRADCEPSEIKTIIYDSNLEYFAWFPMVRDSVWRGEFPHWIDSSYCGNPLYANHLIPVFHVPFAIALLFPGEHVFSAYSLLMALFGTLFFYWFLRNWKLSPFVSFYGAMAFFLSGWQFYLYPPEVATLIWIPAILLFYDRFIDRGKLIDASLCAFSVGQLLIGGYPVYIAHFAYIIAIYFLWRKFHRAFPQVLSIKKWILGIVIIAIGGILMSAVQNYPTWEYSKLTWRSVSTEGEKFRSPQQIVEDKKADLQEKYGSSGFKAMALDMVSKKSRALVPTFLKDQNESRNLIGPIVVYLVMIGQFLAHKKFKVMKILLLIFLLFFLVPPSFVPFARFVPGWSISALLPREVFFFLVFFISSLGLDAIMKLEKRNIPSLVIGILGLIIMLLVPRLHPIFSPLMSNEPVRYSIQTDAAIVASYVCITSIMVFITAWKTLGKKMQSWIWSMIVVVFVLTGLQGNFYIFQYFSERKTMPYTDELRSLKEICGDDRIVRFDPWQQRISFRERLDYILPPNLPAHFGFYDVQGYDNMLLLDLMNFWETLEPDSLIRQRALSHLRDIKSLSQKGFLTSGAGARYIMTRGDLDPELAKNIPGKIKHEGSIDLYEMENYAPPIRLVRGYMTVDSLIGTANLEPWFVILEKPPVLPDGRRIGTDIAYNQDVVELRVFGPQYITEPYIYRSMNRLVMRFNAQFDSILYVGDTYHPRFKAKVDGKEVEIIKANYAFRAIAVPQGEHTVEMYYDGIEVLKSGIISACSLILVFLIGFIDIRKR